MSGHAGAGGQPPVGAIPRERGQEAVVSLEWVLALPVLALVVVGLLEVGGIVRDVLLLHDAARAGARAAATSTGTASAGAAVAASIGDRDPRVEVTPRDRSAGQLVEVRVSVEGSLGGVAYPLSARAVARVEPVVGPGSATSGPSGEP
jgi:Flp pilus assembly protein TadG